MDANYFKLIIDERFAQHFDEYELYLVEHGYPIDKSIRIQRKIFDFVNHSLLTGMVVHSTINDTQIRKFIIEDLIVYYEVDIDTETLLIHNAVSTRQKRELGY